MKRLNQRKEILPLEDEEVNEIQMNPSIKINSIQAKLKEDNKDKDKDNNRKKYTIDEDLLNKIKALEDNLEKRNYPKKEDEKSFNNYNNKENYVVKEDNLDKSKSIKDENEFLGMNDELVKKFGNLSQIEDTMKRLNQMLDYSSKTSLKFKYETEQQIDNKSQDHNLSYENSKDENYSGCDIDEPVPYKRDEIYSIPKNPKKVEINRRVIDFDEIRKEDDLLDNEDEDDELAYLKNILVKTKSDIDNLNKKFDCVQKSEFNNNFYEDEIIPRAPPKYLN